MEWTYKNINITVDNDGFFCANVNQEKIRTTTLQECKEEIDDIVAPYYEFTSKDWSNILKKLTIREQNCLNAIKEALKCHISNPYCQIGINDDYWNWQFLYDK